MMLVTTMAAMIYLIICHEAANWNIPQSVYECVAAANNITGTIV
jgi:hypothetical protein